jgi:hypothetical protein
MSRLRKHLSRRSKKGLRSTRQLRGESLERRLLLATITSENPVAGSHNAATSTDVSATYDEAITSATNQTFSVTSRQAGVAAGTVSVSGNTVTLDPSSNFFPGDVVEVSATSGIQGATAGVPRVWHFRTASTGSGDFVNSGQGLGDPAVNTASWGVDLGDLDGDGDLDVFISNFGANGVYLNDGTGLFTNSGQALGNHFSRNAAIGDVDEDGDLDILVANDNGQSNYGTGENMLWLNNGAGIFTGQVFGGDRRSRDVLLGDVDSDGDLDAMVANSADGNRLYRNNGSGSFSGAGQEIGSYNSQGIAFADFDDDGDLDVIFANGGNAGEDEGHRGTIWTNQGGAQGGTLGNFVDSGQRFENRRVRAYDVGDVDGDGDVDAFSSSADYANRVWLNDGTGVLTDSGQMLSGTGNQRTESMKLGDLDGDGDLDAFVVHNAGATNRFWSNDGTGVFTDLGLNLDADSNSNDVALGDVNGDGTLDAVVANDNTFVVGGSVGRIWINQSGAPSVTLSIDNATIPEAGGAATITATLSAAHTAAVTVDLNITGTATATDDYIASGTQIVIPAGSTTGSVSVTAVQDTVDEPDETVIIDVSNVTNGQEAGAQQVTTTILDDDEAIPVPDVTLLVDNAAIAEAAGVATFTATLSEVTTVPVTVDLGITGTAAASDFTASGTQIVVAPGATTGSITVTAVQDDVDESDETVVVDITNVTGGNESGSQQQTTTITDDDEPPMPDVTLSVDNAEIAEAGGVATFTVTLSESTTVPVTVGLEITGSAAASDYNASATQVVVAAGDTTGSVTVTAVDDSEDESDETVVVDIVAVSGGNEAGEQQQTTTITDDDDPPQLTVTALAPTVSGFEANFSTDVNTSVLNLYDTQSAGLGPADVVVQGATTGLVSGSLVIDPSLRKVTFIKSGDPLASDTYTVTMRSGDDGFIDTGGQVLDGDNDGTAGGDYSTTFEVATPLPNSVTIGISDFVRGPGQEVNLPADETTGIPVTISEGANVRAVDLRVAYDSSLLTITGGTVGADAPAGASVIVNTTTPGLAIVVFFSTNPLPAGSGTFVNLQASVPATDASSIYGNQQVLDVHDVVVSDGNDNEAPVVVDDSLHLASFFADVSGNGRINAADASGVARIAALIDGGFIGSLNSDPSVVGDISGNGRLNAADASLLAQFAALIDVPQIPAIPGGVVITAWLGSSPEERGASPQDAIVDPNPEAVLPVVGPDPYQAVDRVMSDSARFDAAGGETLATDLEEAISELLEVR